MLICSIGKLCSTSIWLLEVSTFGVMDFCEYGYLLYWGALGHGCFFVNWIFPVCSMFPNVTCLGGGKIQFTQKQPWRNTLDIHIHRNPSIQTYWLPTTILKYYVTSQYYISAFPAVPTYTRTYELDIWKMTWRYFNHTIVILTYQLHIIYKFTQT
jgi:hypothetical protein